MSVITHSGLCNRKMGEKHFGHQETEGCTFIVIDGVDWYVRPIEWGVWAWKTPDATIYIKCKQHLIWMN